MADDPPVLEKLRELRHAAQETGVTAAPSAELSRYIDKVRRHAYQVTDEEVAALLAAGHSEQQIYEATMVTALTSGIERFEIGLRALRGVT